MGKNLQNHSARSIDKLSLSVCSFLFQYSPLSQPFNFFTITNSTTVKKTVNKKLTIVDSSFEKSSCCVCVFSGDSIQSEGSLLSPRYRERAIKNFLPDSFKFCSHLSRGQQSLSLSMRVVRA
jgi:hypothetical protein